MADLELQHRGDTTEQTEKSETRETTRPDFEKAQEEQKKTAENIHQTVKPLIIPAEIVPLQESIKSFRTIETTDDAAKLKEQLSKDPDLKLANIPKGSRILTVFQGGPESLSIKYLNDKVIGMQATSDLINERQENVMQAMQEHGLVTAETRLGSTYKLDKFQINDKQLASARDALQKNLSPEELQKLQLSPDPETANQQVIDYILKQAEQKTQAALEKKIALKISDIKQQILHSEKISPDKNTDVKQLRKTLADLEKWHDPDHLRQFTLNFGVSQEIKTDPGTTEAFAERIFADQQGEAWARVNSQRIEGSAYEGEKRLRGSSYNVEGMMADMLRVENLRNDGDLQNFFEDVNGQKVMKLDAIGVLRKWTDFEASNPDPALKAKYEKLKQYYRVLNRFDYIKSWTNIEDAKQETDNKQKLINESNADAMREQLKKNPKGTGDMTDAEFHAEAVDIPKSRYLVFDVIGMGNENVRSFENVYLKINERIKQEAGIATSDYQEIKKLTANNPELAAKVMRIFQEEGMKAGNEVTSSFKEKVALSRQKLQDFYREKGYTGPLTSVPGGDEWTVVVPEELIANDENRLHALLLDIQANTGMRISVARKSLEAAKSPEDTIKAHKEALKNSEKATDFTKKLEKMNITGVFFSQKENDAFASVLQLPDGPRTIKDEYFIWPAVESLQKRGKSPITHADIWDEYQRLITSQPEIVSQAA